MTEEELEHKINEYGEAYYHGEGGGEEEIKASILAAFAELRAERDLLREAVEAVEWRAPYTPATIDSTQICPWCGGIKNHGHASDCLRQRALEVKP